MNKIIVTLVLAMLAIGLLSWVRNCRRCSSSALQEEVLIVGTNAEYPPFTFIKNDTIAGFDIDLIYEVAKRLGKKVEMRDMPFSTLMPQLQLGAIQVIAAGLTPTAERAKQAFFTTPHLQGETFVIVSKKSTRALTSVEDLKGQNVVVNEGFTADLYLAEHGVNARKLPAVADAFLALNSGRADYFVSANTAVQPFFDQYGSEEFEVKPLIEAPTGGVALVVSKEHPALFQSIEQIVQQLIEDGTVATLKRKWSLER